MSQLELEPSVDRWLTENDRDRSATVTHVKDLVRALAPLQGLELQRMFDIGCGFGGLGALVSAHLGIDEVHGIDIDPTALPEARSKGIEARQIELGVQPLPYPDEFFDLIMSLGMMDYLPTYDAALAEMQRVLRPGGYILVALPNLASWHNRLVLFLGYQPRDVEISCQKLTGLMPWYRNDTPTGHIHTATVGAFSELMAHHGFQRVRITGGRPGGRKKRLLLQAIDAIFSTRVTLARRFFYLGTKPHATTSARDDGLTRVDRPQGG